MVNVAVKRTVQIGLVLGVVTVSILSAMYIVGLVSAESALRISTNVAGVLLIAILAGVVLVLVTGISKIDESDS
jgi:hypothetical protein